MRAHGDLVPRSRVRGRKITKGHSRGWGILLNWPNRIPLKTGKDLDISKIGDEEFDQISK